MANLGTILGNLGSITQGYDQGTLNYLKVQQAMREAKARQVFGNSLMQQFAPPPAAAPVPGAQPMPQAMQNSNQAPAPGQPSMPMQRPGMPPQGGMPMPQGGGMPMQRPPMPPQGGGGMAMPQGGGMPQPGGMPTPQQPPRALTWQGIVQNIKKAAPGIDGATLAEVVNQYQPMMAAESKQEWQQVQQAIKMQDLMRKIDEGQNKNDNARDMLDIRQQLADIAGRRADTGEKTATEKERHDMASEKNTADRNSKMGSGKPLTAPQQRRLEAIENTSTAATDLLDLVKKHPNAVGLRGRGLRNLADLGGQAGREPTEDELAAIQMGELSDELEAGLPTVLRYSSYGGGKGTASKDMDIKNLFQSAAGAETRLTQLVKTLDSSKKTFLSTTGRNNPEEKSAPAKDGSGKDDFSHLWGG